MLTQNYSNFTEKMKTTSGKCRINMATLSFLKYAVKVILNLSNNLFPTDHTLWFPCKQKCFLSEKHCFAGVVGFLWHLKDGKGNMTMIINDYE